MSVLSDATAKADGAARSGERVVAVDAVKALACIMVMSVHVLRNINAQVPYHSALYYFGRLAMPLFFMTNGFLQLCKDGRTIKYGLRKISGILTVCSFWILAYNVLMYFAKGRPIRPGELVACYFQKGSFSIFWFFGTMMILYALLPLLSRLFKSRRFAVGATCFLAAVCLCVHIASVAYASKHNVFLQSYVTLTFRLWTWLFYYFLGGCIKSYALNEKVRSTKLLAAVCALCTVGAICDQYYLFKKLTDVVNGQYYYDSPILMIAAASLFLLLMKIDYSAAMRKIINFMSQNLIGCYIFHIRIVWTLVPHMNNLGFFGEYGAILLVVAVTLAISSVVTRIPLLKKMTKI